MEITRENFFNAETQQLIKESIYDADYISIDTEFSGKLRMTWTLTF